MTEDLIERWDRWLQNTGYDGGVNSPPMLVRDELVRNAEAIAARDARIAELEGLLVRAVEAGICGMVQLEARAALENRNEVAPCPHAPHGDRCMPYDCTGECRENRDG